MRVIVAQDAGFCYGVKRATRAAFEAASASGIPVYTLGELIHNPQVVSKLEQAGVRVAETTDEIVEGLVIVRSHGLPPDVKTALMERGLDILDLTCPTVKAVQSRAEELAREGYQVVIIGDRNHPEVQAIAGYAGPAAIIINDEEEAEAIAPTGKLGVVMQTTHAGSSCRKIVAALWDKATEIRVFNTLCSATNRRQEHAVALARQVEAMVVVGGRNSANTGRLAELCRLTGVPTYHVETAADLDDGWFAGVQTVGVTAGTSTPDWVIDEIVKRLNGMNVVGEKENGR